MINFYSTNQKAPIVSLKEAVLNGLAPDGGLYFPEEIPKLSDSFFQKLHEEGSKLDSVILQTIRTLNTGEVLDES